MQTVLEKDEQLKLIYKAKKIAKNKKIRVSANEINTKFNSCKVLSLSKVQCKLLSIHNYLNHQILMQDIQLLAAVGYFLTFLSKCNHLQYSVY